MFPQLTFSAHRCAVPHNSHCQICAQSHCLLLCFVETGLFGVRTLFRCSGFAFITLMLEFQSLHFCSSGEWTDKPKIRNLCSTWTVLPSCTSVVCTSLGGGIVGSSKIKVPFWATGSSIKFWMGACWNFSTVPSHGSYLCQKHCFEDATRHTNDASPEVAGICWLTPRGNVHSLQSRRFLIPNLLLLLSYKSPGWRENWLDLHLTNFPVFCIKHGEDSVHPSKVVAGFATFYCQTHICMENVEVRAVI